MELQRSPRRLFYKWASSSEIEYPTDIPSPSPEITTATIQVPIPRTFPVRFGLHATQSNGTPIHPPNALAFMWSWSEAYFVQLLSGNSFYYRIYGTNQLGQQIQAQESFLSYLPGTGFISPGQSLAPRCDLVVGGDRITNPTINAPCPTWRIAGGKCPDGSIDCGNCCLDCASINSAINGLTSSVLPYSTWSPK